VAARAADDDHSAGRALLVTGIARMVATARAGAMARRTLGWFLAVLARGTLLARVATPAVLEAFPIPGAAAAALAADSGAAPPVPGIGAFFETLVAPNIVAAAAETAMLPLVVFFAALALAIMRCPRRSARRCWPCSRRSARRCWW
jgi:Na+/H+-dicarboxylate symporter